MKTTVILYWLRIALGAVTKVRTGMVDNEDSRVIWLAIDQIDAHLNAAQNLLREIERK